MSGQSQIVRWTTIELPDIAVQTGPNDIIIVGSNFTIATIPVVVDYVLLKGVLLPGKNRCNLAESKS